MSPELINAAGITLLALTALSAGVLAFNKFAPARYVAERHDLALASIILAPIVLILALQPSATEIIRTAAEAAPIAASERPVTTVATQASPTVTTPAPSGIRFEWSMIALLAGAAISLTLMARLVRDVFGLAKLRRDSRPARLPADLKLSREIDVRSSHTATSPLLVGYLRPVILLPRDFVFDDSARPVLEHEIAHLERRDPWTVLGLRLLMVALWWVAPLHALLPILNTTREALCDSRAARITQTPHQLATALLDAASRALQSSHTRQIPALALASTPNRSALAARIDHLTSPRVLKRSHSPMRLSIILPLLATSALVLTPHVGAAETVIITAEQDEKAGGNRHGHGHPRGDHRDYVDVDDRRNPDAALFRAASRGRLAEVRQLIADGADVNYVFRGDGTALIAAIRRGRNDVVTELLANGADANLMVGGDGSPMIAAARHGDISILNQLLEANGDPNLAIHGDGNPLIAASQHGETEMVTALLDRGADVNFYIRGDETPLINAAQSGHVDVAELLVAAGADLSLTVLASNRDGSEIYRSPLSEARRMNRGSMISWLEARGAEHRPPAD
jgi:beta-lactamase regulating signal transducer with metallopeptidase domain